MMRYKSLEPYLDKTSGLWIPVGKVVTKVRNNEDLYAYEHPDLIHSTFIPTDLVENNPELFEEYRD